MTVLQPPAAVLAGAPGAGKTFSLITAINAGLELFVLSTEPGGTESLIDAAERLKAPIDKLHWATVLPRSSGLDAMMNMTDMIGKTPDYDVLARMKDKIGKENFRETAMRVLHTIKNFHCERTKRDFGCVMDWNDTRCFALDGLTGLSIIAWKLTVGYKPTGAPADYGISQNWLSSLLNDINCDRKCFFVLTTHVEKEPDELTGVKKLHVSTIGQKLAPKVPNFFSEVILARRTTDKLFTWATIDNGMDLKNRALPIGIELAQDFRPIVEAYQRRIKFAGAATPQAPTTAAVQPAPVLPSGGLRVQPQTGTKQ